MPEVWCEIGITLTVDLLLETLFSASARPIYTAVHSTRSSESDNSAY